MSLALALSASPACAQSAAVELVSEAEAAIAEDDFDTAGSVLGRAFAAARAARDPEAQERIAELRKRANLLDREFKKLKNARATLAKSPSNQEANTQVGSFYCFIKRDWPRGLPLLARGEEGVLRDAARRDVADPHAPDAQSAVANAWLAAAADIGGEPREQMHLRARDWCLRAVEQIAEEDTRKLIYQLLDKIELFPSKIVIWNTCNGGMSDRGTLNCKVTFLLAGKSVIERTQELAWTPGKPVATTIVLPHVRIDELRVDVVSWHQNGGGLAEVEVYQADSNLALHSAAEASGSWDGNFTPDHISDGVRDVDFRQSGIWLLPDRTAGWIRIQLNRR